MGPSRDAFVRNYTHVLCKFDQAGYGRLRLVAHVGVHRLPSLSTAESHQLNRSIIQLLRTDVIGFKPAAAGQLR